MFFVRLPRSCFIFFFFNDTATTEIYTLSLHDALPILPSALMMEIRPLGPPGVSSTLRNAIWHPSGDHTGVGFSVRPPRSEEHTSELQSRLHLVCRLLLEKKKNTNTPQDQVVEAVCIYA